MANVVKLRSKPNDLKQAEQTTYYRFTDPDPVMETVANAIAESGWKVADVVKGVYNISNGVVNLHYQTVENWLNGRTRRPQHYNVVWVMKALGFEERWVRRKIRANARLARAAGD